jgi:hypothetical protein
MYVKWLFYENTAISNPHSSERRVHNPTWDQIEAAIRVMDGEARTTLMITPSKDAETFLGVGGGGAGYFCFVLDRFGNEYALVDPSQTSTACVQVLIGELTTRPINERVDLDRVLQAARAYAEAGRLDDELVWRRC